ncbi:hypothetical protein N7456_008481 [Penicillium angulare]|uniref:B3/B4 tRNA-binding domain-containing protein n=1 Tax=Penicillium angulare TaxID=116970 RepID=A0A9W9FCK9_9EURO|nr:hypothetical protein N7456_008481 [Penicillium angulare]
MDTILNSAHISPSIFSLRPDYRALLMIAENIPTGPSDESSSRLLNEAESHIKSLLSSQGIPITEFPHIFAWRETYKGFGAKPQKTRNSLEALTRRAAEGGLPRINRLTDIYNAISVKHQVPIGGEDLDKYDGAPFLVRANGEEEFRTFSAGEAKIESAVPGEPIWCDDVGITCRRWNWRQGPRTALSDESTRVLFILDALEPLGDDELVRAADELADALKGLSGDVKTLYQIIRAGN